MDDPSRRERASTSPGQRGLEGERDTYAQGFELDPDDDIPITLDLVFRRYACLTPGDEVADAAGRAWRFDTPWDWRLFDGATPDEPRRPLALLTRRPPSRPRARRHRHRRDEDRLTPRGIGPLVGTGPSNTHPDTATP
ncbi:hypothetical protein AB0D59_43775 [Streptomyces sp. NPDC048417]|uniref:hypothetical protein n=1 Tax=Streptomyces sp. NPDC048417 TaxID=3155387 RepID=UPI003413E468